MVQVDGRNGSGKVNNGPVGAAGSEILAAGQRLIVGMRSTTGSGEPDAGHVFGTGARRFGGAEEAVAAARPGEDWLGGAARAYADANQRLADRAASMSVLDRGVQAVVAREAEQVVARRESLDGQATYLSDLGLAAGSIAQVPGVGPALKAAFDMTAVNTAVGACESELQQMAGEVQENCTTLRQIADEYATLGTPAAAAPAAGPADATTGITSALGVVGGIVGAIVSPLAAVLSGAAGAAGQSLSALTSPGVSAGSDPQFLAGTDSHGGGGGSEDLDAEDTEDSDRDDDVSTQPDAGTNPSTDPDATESEETAPLPPITSGPDHLPAATRPPQF